MTEEQETSSATSAPPGWLAWGQLLRISMTPSALSDAGAGLLLGAGLWPGGQGGWMLLASFCAYHGGMALNDWADSEHDARTRPERPIPSGAVRHELALAVSLALLFAGPAIAWWVSPAAGMCMALVSVCAATYDLCGRGALLGPLLLGVCRAGNLGAAMLAGRALSSPGVGLPDATLWIACALYGGYVFWLSRLGRLEDGEDSAPLEQRPRAYLYGAMGCMAAVPLVLGVLQLQRSPGTWGWIALAASGAVAWFAIGPLAQLARHTPTWTRGDVMRGMGMGLRRLLVFTALLALASGSPHALWVGAGILSGYPVAHGLRELFPPS